MDEDNNLTYLANLYNQRRLLGNYFSSLDGLFYHLFGWENLQQFCENYILAIQQSEFSQK